MASSWEELKKRKQGEKKAADVQGRSLPEKTHYTWEELKAKKNGNVSAAEADAEAASSSGNGSVRYTWEQLKAKKAGLPLVPTEAQKSVKRGTYTSEVTTPYSEAAAAAYRKFKGEDAPASSLNVGAGTPAAKKVAGSFVGPLQQKYIREETQEKQRTPLKPLEEYAAQKSKRIGAGEAARTDYTTVVDDPEYSKYRWIGEGMVDNPVAKANADADYTRLNAMTSNNPAVQETAGYTYMTKEQQDIYNYLFGNTEQYGKEAAQDYYDRFVRDSVNAQQGEGLAQGIKELPTWFKPVGYGMASVATGADGAMEGYKGLSDFVAGNEDARAKSATQYAGERLAQDMNLPGRIAWDVGSAVGQQLPQMTVGFLTGGLGTALRAGATSLTQAASILGSRYNEELRSGASVEEARKAAIASAAIETATEMVGGVEMLSGFTLSGKKIDKLVDGISSAVGKIAVRTGFDMLGEGFEEGVSGVLEPLVRQYILGQGEAEINVEEVAYQALIGALSGGVLGAPVNTANAIAENREKAARAAAQSVKSEETTPEQKHNAAKKALEIADVEKADELADAVVKMANGEELTQEEMQAVATTEGALEVAKLIAGAEVNQKAADDAMEAADAVAEENAADWEEAPEELDGAEQDAWYNRQRAVSAAAKLGGERRIHEEIYDMGGGQQDAEAYADEFERAYNRGANNLKLTDEIAASYTTLNPDQAQAAWNEGRKAYETTIAKAPARSKVSMNGNVGSVDATALKGLKLNTNQRAAIRASQTIAEALGIKVVWEASEANEQGKRESMNGWYLPKDQSIHLDIYAGSVDATQSAAFQYATMRTFSHELTHYIQDQSPAQYAQLRDMVFGYLQEQGMDVEALIEEKAKNYSKVNGYTRFDVTQEVIADACEMMLRDSTAVETAMKKDPSLWERIKEKFAEFVEDLRAAFGRVDKLHPEARALMREAEGVLQYAEDLQRKWDEALLSTMEEKKNHAEEQRNTEQYAPRNYDVEISQNEIDSNIELVKKMEPVVMLKGDEAILHDGNLKENVLDFYQKNGNVATNRVLGDVQLTKSSYKSDMGHGMTPLKALTFWAVPGTIEKGEIISYSENWKDRGYRTYVIAAPITIEQGERRGDYWSGVVVKADANMQNVYAHDALMIKKEGPAALQNGAAANAGDTVGYRSSIHKILQQLNEVKREEQKEATETKREGVDLMEERSWESIKDRSMRPFVEEVPEVREWFAMAAELLRDDLVQSTPGQKMYIPVQGNEPGTVNVTGQKRSTVDEIAQLLDRGMTYRNIGDALDAYAQIDLDWIRKHPQTAKKVELMLDQILTEGYTNIEGESVPGVEDYKALMDELAGREAKEPVEYDLGEDMVFSRRDTSLDLSDMRRYQERDETYVSNRELLANALEGAAQTVAEKNKIAEYKRRVRSLDIAENRAAFVREEMAEINRDLKDKNLRDSEKAELNERLDALREQRDRLDREINEADKVLLKLEATEPLQKVVNRERKAAMDRVRAKANERRDVDKYKQRIANKVASLTVLLTRPSTKKYLPDPIRGPVAEFLSSISFVSKRQLQGGKPTQKDMKFAESLAALQRVMSKVRERYNDAETSDVVQEGFGGYLDLPEGFVKSLTTLSEKVEQDAKHSEEGYNVNMMSIAQLESLDEIITTLKKSIENVNKFLGENLYKHVDQAARDTFVDLGDMKNRTRTTDAGEFFEWENAMPAYAFDRFGRGGKAVFNGLVHGQGKLGMNAKQVIDFANDTYTAEEARKWAEDIKTFRFGDDELKIPVTHIMSLYCLRKREQAQGHLQGEGIRVADFEYKGRKYKDPGRTVDDRMLDEIVSVLSDRQKAVADKLQAYMVEVGSEWGNEVSMRRFGYRAFEEKNYFPINSDGNHLAAVSEEGGKGNAMYALLNISPTKELTPKANNRLMLYNIFDVFANHMSDMAQYNAMALPLLDAIKWINYKESTKLPGSDARHTRSMQDAINMAYGEPARRYVIRMLEDVSGRKATVSEDKMTGKMLGRVNRAAVAANLRVALLQPLSLIRAGMDMNAVPIVMGFARNPVHLRENIEKMQKYSGIAVWKDLGFRELNISRGLKKLIKHDETVMENIVDKSMILAEAADKFTWAAMWEAAEIQTAKTMSRSDEGFYTAVRDLFERTVYRTQVVDSVLTKSQYMRTPAGMNKLFSSFMSEPVTTYNMLADMVWKISDESRRLAAKDIAENGQPKNKAEAAQRAAKYVRGATKVNAKLVGRTFTVYGASVVATTLLEAVMTAWRDDDDYEKFMDKLKETTIWDWIDNMNPLAMVPVGSQLWDLFKMALNKLGSDAYGFEMTLPMTDIFNTATDLYDMWSKWSQGKGSATGYGVAYKGAQLVSDVVGLPFASFAREGISLWNNAVASFVPELRVTTYATPDVNGASAYLRAVRENDDRLAAEMMAELEANNVTGGDLLDAMEDAIKAAYKSGGMDKDEAARLLEKYAGYENEKDDKYAAERLVREWDTRAESGNDSAYGNVWNYISDWDGKALKAEIKELKALGVKESSIRTSVTNHFKEAYLQATGREKTDLKAHLITAFTMLGMTSADAKKKIESWKEE